MSISEFIDKDELKFALQLIKQVKISSPPQLLLTLKDELSQPAPDIKKVISLVKGDVALVSKILKTLNSVAFNLTKEITSIEQAVTLLGIKNLKDTIIQPAYQQALNQSMDGFEELSEISSSVGKIAVNISKEIEDDLEGQFYLVGLFHLIGVFVLSKIYPDYMGFYEKNILHPVTFPVKEKEKYGVRNTSIAVLLAKSWGLTNTTCNAVYLQQTVYATYYKKLDPDTITLAASLKLAKYFVHKDISLLSVNNSLECTIFYDTAISELMLNEENLTNIEGSIEDMSIK